MANRRWLVPLVIVVVAIVAIAGSLTFLYFHNSVTAPSSPVRAAAGANATVNYIGIFGSGPEEGKVFDTSIYSIAINNAQYPKALQFSLRGGAANYTPLGVYLGASTPSGGYTLGNDTFVGVVTGFWEGILGMTANQTKTVVVPPDLGYGPTDPACLATQPLIQTIPQTQTMTGIAFQAAYPGITAADGREFSDPHYGWTDEILSANSSFVTVEAFPYVGQIVSPGGWPIEVTAIHSTPNGTGAITLTNELTPGDAGHLQGKDFLGTGPCSSTSNGKFIVTAVNVGNGTFTENYNEEVQGQTLIFIITLVDYFPIGTTDA